MKFEEYKGLRVVVTGVSSGIGKATAQMLIDNGAEVIGLSRRVPEDLALAQHIYLDLADEDCIRKAAEQIEAPVDCLFNIAGSVPMTEPITLLKINFLGQRLFTELLVEKMHKGSTIVNCSSDGGYGWRRQYKKTVEFVETKTIEEGIEWYQAHPEVGHPYAYSKEALDVWSYKLSTKLFKEKGIRVNVESPGAVKTEMLDLIEGAFGVEMVEPTLDPSGYRSDPKEQALVLLFMGSPENTYTNGSNICVDGGLWARLVTTGTYHDTEVGTWI